MDPRGAAGPDAPMAAAPGERGRTAAVTGPFCHTRRPRRRRADPAGPDDRRRMPQHAQVRRRIVGVDAPGRRARPARSWAGPSQSRAPCDGGEQRLPRRRSARPARSPRRRPGRARRSRRRRSRRARRPRPRPRCGSSRRSARAGRACARRRSGSASAASANDGKFAMLITVGTRCTPRSAAAAMVSSVSPVPCSMQSTPGGQQPGQRVLAEHVGGHPGAAGVRDGDRLGQHVVRPQRREIADVPVDPVADDLDPAVAVRDLPGHLARAARPGPRDRRPARGCTAWCGRCAGRP